MTLHVGLNCIYWQPESGGSGTYARELIRALRRVAPDLRLTGWIGRGAPDDVGELDIEWIRQPLRSSGSPVHVAYELGLLGLSAARRGVDVVHGPAYATPLIAPGVATVVTLLDLTWWHQPESAPRLARTMFRLMTHACGRTADRVIAISETVRDDLVATARIPPDKIDVTPLGVAHEPVTEPTPEADLRTRLHLPVGAPVLLCVAQLAPHKNLGALIRALPSLPDVRLVVPGRRTAHADDLVALAASLGVGDRLVLPGFVDAADLECLYSIADGFALPSLLEGFGLPILEAMRRGVPVACSETSALPEVAGGAALLFDPRDDASVLSALRRLLSNPGDIATRGRARAAELTWDRTARLTLASYARAAER